MIITLLIPICCKKKKEKKRRQLVDKLCVVSFTTFLIKVVRCASNNYYGIILMDLFPYWPNRLRQDSLLHIFLRHFVDYCFIWPCPSRISILHPSFYFYSLILGHVNPYWGIQYQNHFFSKYYIVSITNNPL